MRITRIVVGVVAMGAMSACASAETSSGSDPDDFYRTPDGIVERDEYDPAVVWNNMSAVQRRDMCTNYSRSGGFQATVDMLVEAGYSYDDSVGVANFARDNCPATTTTTTNPPPPPPPPPPPSDEYNFIREAQWRDSFLALSDLEQLSMCQAMWDAGGPSPFSVALYESGEYSWEDAGIVGIVLLQQCS